MTRYVNTPHWRIHTSPGFRLGLGIVPHHRDGDREQPRDGWDALLWLGPLIIRWASKRTPAPVVPPVPRKDAFSRVFDAVQAIRADGGTPWRVMVAPDVRAELKRMADKAERKRRDEPQPPQVWTADRYRSFEDQVFGIPLEVDATMAPGSVVVLRGPQPRYPLGDAYVFPRLPGAPDTIVERLKAAGVQPDPNWRPGDYGAGS